jgi:uncharacterized Fe-S cluster-containing MiaB family protein
MRRYSVNKGKSAKQFRKQASKTKVANLRSNPMRGGWRL